MPQLRDSGNHSTAPLDAHTKDEIQSFARIFVNTVLKILHIQYV